MAPLADRIMQRVRGHGRGRWVCTPRDFLDLGGRAAVGQALSRLTRTGQLRRVGRGLYDLPRFSRILNRFAPADLKSAVAAVARRDSIRIMRAGGFAANTLGLTDGVPAKAAYVTDGRSRRIEVDGWTVHLRRERATVMNWHGRPGAPVVQALYWLGPHRAVQPQTADILRNRLPDYIKRDLTEGRDALPAWAVPIVDSIAGSAPVEPPGPGPGQTGRTGAGEA